MIPIRNHSRSALGLATLLLGALSFGASAFGQVLVNDTRPGLNRTGVPGPSAARWLLGGSLVAAGATPALSIPCGAAPGSLLGYFTEPGYAAAIAIGETLTASFDFSLSSIGSASGVTALRFGFFDSGGSRATDHYALSGKTFTHYIGYAALLSTRAFGAGITIRERIPGTNHFLNSTANPPFSDPVPTATGGSKQFKAGTRYTASLSATRTGVNTVDFSVTLSGGDFGNYRLSYTDNASPTLAFDTVGIGWAAKTLATDGVVTVERLHVSISGGEPPETDDMVAW